MWIFDQLDQVLDAEVMDFVDVHGYAKLLSDAADGLDVLFAAVRICHREVAALAVHLVARKSGGVNAA
ncbi:hypothetical protein [Rhodoblastus sphagnicola]|uniref:hypothetical protein n=1 Tax=Rhodoblastus sphagnicola TaxID=333368 RepID=UPI00161F4FA5|nr:hypothetical protein [Rhodoblastus sphagnicola]